jgi:hypothetical protein
MSDRLNTVSDPPPPELEGEQEVDVDHPEKEAQKRRVSATDGNIPAPRRARRPVAIGGYTINRAGQVIVDPSEVFNDPEKLEEALKVARRAQDIGRRLTAARS